MKKVNKGRFKPREQYLVDQFYERLSGEDELESFQIRSGVIAEPQDFEVFLHDRIVVIPKARFERAWLDGALETLAAGTLERLRNNHPMLPTMDLHYGPPQVEAEIINTLMEVLTALVGKDEAQEIRQRGMPTGGLKLTAVRRVLRRTLVGEVVSRFEALREESVTAKAELVESEAKWQRLEAEIRALKAELTVASKAADEAQMAMVYVTQLQAELEDVRALYDIQAAVLEETRRQLETLPATTATATEEPPRPAAEGE